MIESGPAPCPVHPTTYHDRIQVLPAGSRRIFRFESVVGLPRRCAVLETELMEADREIDLMDYLWVLERKGRGSRVFTALLSVTLGTFVGLMAASGSDAVVSMRTLVVTLIVSAAVGLLAEAASARVFNVRLRRILDWRKRVGF